MTAKRDNTVRSPVWVLAHVVSPSGHQQLRLGIPDTVLFQDGAVQAWLFTSKTGEVLAKRSVRKAAVKERFTRLSSTNPNNPQRRVATVRFGDGTVRNLGQASFKEMMQKFPPAEPGILAIQCYIQSKGLGGTVYRNSYTVVNDKGLVVTSTSSFTTLHSNQFDLPISSWSNSDVNLVKSNAVRINVALDSVTQSIVKFLEAGQKAPTRILHMDCDYVIDEAGQIWLVWVGDTTIALGDAAQDLRLADVRKEGLYGRGTFLGREVALAMHRDMGGPPTPAQKGRVATSFASDAFNGRQRVTSKAIDRAAEVVELPRGAGVGGVGGIVDAISHAALMEKENDTTLRGRNFSASSALVGLGGDSGAIKASCSTMAVGMRDAEAAANESRGRAPGGKHYPSSFSCMGDFCAVRVLDPRGDSDNPQLEREAGSSILYKGNEGQNFIKEVAIRLFSAQELSALRRDAQFRRQIDEGLVMEVEVPKGSELLPLQSAHGTGIDPIAGGLKDRDGKEWAEVILRSILLARQERKRVEAAGGGVVPGPEQGLQREGAHSDIIVEQEQGVGGAMSALPINGSISRVLQETEASLMRQHARKREDDLLAGGAQNYYTSVRVCSTCFQVYTLLDRARLVLAQQAVQQKAETAAYERSEYLDPARAATPGHRQRRRHCSGSLREGRSEMVEDEGEREGPLSVSFEDIDQSFSRPSLPVHPQSQGDRPMPASSTLSPEGQGQVPGKGRTWRGRLEESNYPAGRSLEPILPSGRQFEDLDDYLRGRAAKAVKKSRNHKRQLGHDIVVTDAIKKISQEEEVGAQSDRQLYHAQVLLAEGDPALAMKTKDVLEEEGYLVTVDGDGKQVVEAVIAGDGEWDVLLVDRDLPVMDGFGVTTTVRNFEKTQRNRAASLRANKVEEYQKMDKTRAKDSGQAPSSVPEPAEVRHLPIICITDRANPDDLRSYMAVGMDGCVSKPLEPGPLLSTLRAAVPRHLTLLGEAGRVEGGVCFGASKAVRSNGLGILTGSAATAAEGMALPARSLSLGSVEGALRIDADTSVPYCVVGMPPAGGKGRFFNLVVCHDMFDTYERMKIILKPVLARYPGTQALLWNYPGQAFSEWREEQLLNNEYLANVLQHLILHVGSKEDRGTGEFNSRQPFHLVGFGNGGAVATFHASHFSSGSSLRSLLLLNSFSYVDAYLAGVMHDCTNVFSCSPEARPDLPVYFYTRFLFSAAYLAQVSTPLALNIYTAVHNPITVKGRVQLCKGTLAHVDTRPALKEIDVPVVCVQSTQNNLVKPLHTDPYVTRRGGEVRSIHKVLNDPQKTCVVWMNAGHEIFQEAKGQATMLLEQMVAGYHESNDVVYAMSNPGLAGHSLGNGQDGPQKQGQGQVQGYENHAKRGVIGASNRTSSAQKSGEGPRVLEDDYIDKVLETMDEIQADADHKAIGNKLRSASAEEVSPTGRRMQKALRGEGKLGEVKRMDQSVMDTTWDGYEAEVYGSTWEEYRKGVITATSSASHQGIGHGGTSNGGWSAGRSMQRRQLGRGRGVGGIHASQGSIGTVGRDNMMGTVLDATHPAFERQGNLVYGFGQGSRVYPEPEEFPEVKEYMTWRLKRNRKRLIRLDNAARKVQGVLRRYLAYKSVENLKKERAVVYIQRIFRGWQGRLRFLERLRMVWASQVVQRNWRGHASRRWFELLRQHQAASGHIQRVWRASMARNLVTKRRTARHYGATRMQ
ncbi:unnamed protein product, partial [Choristocarpus tenellus]